MSITVTLELDSFLFPKKMSPSDHNPVYYAISNGMELSVKKALREGEDICANNHLISRFNETSSVPITSLLVEYGANFQAFSLTRVHVACRQHLAVVVSYLLELDWHEDPLRLDIFHQLLPGNTPDMLQYLLEHGIVDLYDKQQTGDPALFQHVDANGASSMMKLLASWGADFYRPDGSIDDGWLAACCLGDVKAVKHFLASNIRDVNDTDIDGNSGTILASMWGQKEVLSLLLRYNPSLEQTDQNGNTALHWASVHNHVDCVEMLLDAGALLEAECQLKSTALLLAAMYAATETARLLIYRGANVHQKMNSGFNTFLVACGLVKDEGEDVIDMLLDKGAVSNIDVVFGLEQISGFRLAAKYNRLNITRHLLKRGANINQLYSLDQTALHICATNGDADMTKLLLEHGININAVDALGRTALQIAVRLNLYYVVKVLLEAGAERTIQGQGNNVTVRNLAVRWPELLALFD